MAKKNEFKMKRRGFIGNLSAGAAAMGFTMFARPLSLVAEKTRHFMDTEDPDEWFNKIKGKHRVVFDASYPRDMLTFAWPKVFLMTNAATGTPDTDCGVVVVLRHEAIPFAMESSLWEKYKFGETYKLNDPQTGTPAKRNPYWQPQPGDFKVPGVGAVEIGINQLQDQGVMFCVCDVALTVNSAGTAAKMNLKPEDVKKEWVSGVLPGIEIVPSGVWAVGRAQEHGCTYCFAG